MFWKKKDLIKKIPKEVPEEKLTKEKELPKEELTKYKDILINDLIIHTKSYGTVSWKIEPWEGTLRIEPWLKFYKWFFGRSGDFFIMKFDKGETMIRRDEIITFSVIVKSKNVIDKD